MDHGRRLAALLAVTLLSMSCAAGAAGRRDPLQHDVSLVEPGTPALQLAEPIPGAPISSTFGWRENPVLKRERFHAGVDFAAGVGTPVHSAAPGRIVKIKRARDRGLYVVIRHADGVKTVYSHLS
ncbi:MAG TPA: M23 family metallopeptidase, partial [Nevskiaceae bacterium]|nr:M23 family metallopeptidase [Nevskiaceae bacterium]